MQVKKKNYECNYRNKIEASQTFYISLDFSIFRFFTIEAKYSTEPVTAFLHNLTTIFLIKTNELLTIYPSSQNEKFIEG